MKNYARGSSLTINYLSIVAIPFFLVGCNTIEGAGTDIKEGGKAIERAAESNKENVCTPPCPSTSQHSRSRQY